MNRQPFRCNFRSHSGAPISDPSVWLSEWSADFPKEKYPPLDRLLRAPTLLTAADFEYVGRWKDGALKGDKWRKDVASVAFVVWMQAANELPGTQTERVVAPNLLAEWSSKTYIDEFPRRTVRKRFGLARATTILHVLSGGQYPILDSRVRRAFKRLTGANAYDKVDWYLGSYVPFFSQIASECAADDMKAVDNALFVYGRKEPYFA
jgi:hypothetical protein